MKLLFLATFMVSMCVVLSEDIHMHLHFENLPLERRLALSKMLKEDLAQHKGVRSTFCKMKCIFKRGQAKQDCKRQCEIDHDGKAKARTTVSNRTTWPNAHLEANDHEGHVLF